MGAEFAPDESAVWDALRTVSDPEVGENVVDLGLVYRIDCASGRVRVEMTMTSPGCPMSGAIAAQAEDAIRNACADVREVKVDIVFDPPWTPERMSEQVRQRFGW
ncbi:MAG TPA: metal-sulfur cluster assembly factor [Burkholderiales bacterium]|nr:metal-sulfur cluster assembly factor [Burkholderiales bacterium]